MVVAGVDDCSECGQETETSDERKRSVQPDMNWAISNAIYYIYIYDYACVCEWLYCG